MVHCMWEICCLILLCTLSEFCPQGMTENNAKMINNLVAQAVCCLVFLKSGWMSSATEALLALQLVSRGDLINLFKKDSCS